MTTCFLAPDPIQGTFFIPGGNTPGNGVQLFLYAAGSSTKQTAYKDHAAAAPWSNPIVLDSGGNLPNGAEVWFPTGQTFKAVWAPSNDTDPPASPYRTMDNLAGMNDVANATSVEWISGPAPTFVSGTQFTMAGDQTANFTNGRRLKSTNTAGTVYSTITSVSFAANTTTVNVASDGSGALDSGLTAVFYGLLDPANPSIAAPHVNRKGNAIASSGTGTTNIWSTVGDYVHITGTNTISFFSTAPYAGARKEVIFDGALSLTFANPSMLISGGANVSTVANDRAVVRADTVSTYIVEFVRNSSNAQSTFTASLTGCTTTPTGLSTYNIVNGVVTVNYPPLTGFSSTTACTITGQPAAIQPATAHNGLFAVTQDNSALATAARADVGTNGNVTLFVSGNSATFTNTNVKGIIAGLTLTYNLN